MSESPGRLSKFSHVDLVVSSIDVSLPFYRDLLEPVGPTYWAASSTIAGE